MFVSRTVQNLVRHTSFEGIQLVFVDTYVMQACDEGTMKQLGMKIHMIVVISLK